MSCGFESSVGSSVGWLDRVNLASTCFRESPRLHQHRPGPAPSRLATLLVWMVSLAVLLGATGQSRTTLAAPRPTSPPPGAKPILVAPAAQLPADREGIKFSWVDGPEKGEKAVRAEVAEATVPTYRVQYTATSNGAVQDGDVLLAVLTLRGAGRLVTEASTQLVFEELDGEWRKSVEFDLSVGREWQTFYVPFVARGTFPAGKTHIALRLGYAPQWLEVGSARVLNYGKKLTVSDLPLSTFDYPGREPDARWRKEAEQRIERIRKGDLQLNVVDAAGKPVTGATVQLRQTRQAFNWGTDVNTSTLINDQSEAAQRYRKELVRLFNYGTPGNALKWPVYEGNPQFARDTVQWLRDHGLKVRGHNMVWPSWKPWFMPERVRAEYMKRRDDPSQGPEAAREWLRNEVETRITNVGRDFAGQLVDWDVANEIYLEHDVLRILGNDDADILTHWFNLARKADPTARLVLNENGITNNGGNDRQHEDYVVSVLQKMVKNAAPIQAVGLQCHMGWRPAPPERLIEILDRLASTGLAVQITEFDINVTDLKLQADYTRDILYAAFAHPAVDTFVMWGFWEANHWIPSGAMYNKDWTPKPNAKVYEDLVLNKWMTRLDGKTNARGQLASRVFKGTYDVTVRGNKPGGGTVEVKTSFEVTDGSKPTAVTVELKPGT